MVWRHYNTVGEALGCCILRALIYREYLLFVERCILERCILLVLATSNIRAGFNLCLVRLTYYVKHTLYCSSGLLQFGLNRNKNGGTYTMSSTSDRLLTKSETQQREIPHR